MLKLCNNSLNIKKKNPRMYITSIVCIFSLHFYIHSMKSFNVAMICICKQSKHLLYQHILKQKSSEKFLVHSTSKSKVQSSSSVCYFFFLLLWTIWVNIEEKPPLENFGKTAIRQTKQFSHPNYCTTTKYVGSYLHALGVGFLLLFVWINF